MPGGNRQAVYISSDDVRTALDAMVYPSTASPSLDSLRALVLVDEFLANPDLPRIAEARTFAIYEILTTIIKSELTKQRNVLGVVAPSPCETLADCTQNIVNDYQQNSLNLAGWSLLYHCHVRTDLNLSLDSLGEIVGLSVRTLRRYRQHAVDRLTRSLIDSERDARSDQRKRRLISRLPSTRPLELIGRERTLENIHTAVQSNPTATMIVTGPVGVGKSALVQEFLRSYITAREEPLIDHLIWIDSPESVQAVYDQLDDQLLAVNSSIGLREWMNIYRLAVVIDGATSLAEPPSKLDSLLQFLEPALVCVISNRQLYTSHPSAHIQLKELDGRSAEELIQKLYITASNSQIFTLAEYVVQVRKVAGGNPLAIRLASQAVAAGDLHGTVATLDRLLGSIYANLSKDEKRAFAAFALCPANGISTVDLVHLWSDLIDFEHVSTLIQRHLVEVVSVAPQTCRLLPCSRQYLIDRYKRSPSSRSLIDTLLQHLDRQISKYPVTALRVVSYVATLDWLHVDSSKTQRWLELLLSSDVEPREWAVPIRNVEAHSSHLPPEYLLEYGTILRRLSRWGAAANAFQEVIRTAGQIGNFILQAQARLELSIVLRYQGDYEGAVTHLEHASETARRYQSKTLLYHVGLERAQIAIDWLDGPAALEYLEILAPEHSWSTRYHMLLAEACLLVGDLQRCRDHVRSAFELIGDKRLLLGRAYDLLGRSYLRAGDYQEARHHLGTSLSYFDTAEDPFALGRCLANFGAACLYQGADRAAGDALKRAHEIQRKLGDELGLIATERNLELLRRNQE